MNHYFNSFLCIVFLTLSLQGAYAQENPSQQKKHMNGLMRSMWVWAGQKPGNMADIITNNVSQDEFFTFINAPFGNADKRINTIYAEAYLSENHFTHNQLAAFIKRASSNGIGVEFLSGGNHLILTSRGKREANNYTSAVIAYNKSRADPAERFIGIHYDIEPHTLDGWSVTANNLVSWEARQERQARNNADKKSEICTNQGGKNIFRKTSFPNANCYLRNVADLFKATRKLINASGQNLTLAADFARFYGAHTDPNNPEERYAASGFFRDINSGKVIDYIGVMNYYDTYKAYVGGVKTQTGRVIGNLMTWDIPLVFGVETGSQGNDVLDSRFPNVTSEILTFYEEGNTKMEAMLDQVIRDFSDDEHFKGVAIHQYLSYKNLKE